MLFGTIGAAINRTLVAGDGRSSTELLKLMKRASHLEVFQYHRLTVAELARSNTMAVYSVSRSLTKLIFQSNVSIYWTRF
jgi:hypothetical protein